MVEKENSLADLYSTLIKSAGYELEISKGGEDALKKVLSGNYLATIVDTDEQDSIWFVERVRGISRVKVSTIPVLCLIEEGSSASRYIDAGATKTLERFPASGEKLISVIRDLLNLARFVKK